MDGNEALITVGVTVSPVPLTLSPRLVGVVEILSYLPREAIRSSRKEERVEGRRKYFFLSAINWTERSGKSNI